MKHRGGQWKRACDVCGWNGPFNKLKYIGQGRWACVDDKNGWTAEQIARHQARMKPLRVRPRPHAKIQGEIPTYQGDEAALFSRICSNATTAASLGPTGAVTLAIRPQEAADCGLYLCGLLDDGQRPTSWITRATTSLTAIGTYLLTQQYGSATGPSPAEATSSILYGGVLATTTLGAMVTSFAGIIFLKLYALTGIQQWLDGADRCAWFLRQNQRADTLTAGFNTGPGGGRQFLGAWSPSITTGKVVQQTFLTSLAICLWFCGKYRTVRGASFSLGTTTASGDFASPPSGTVQNMIDGALSFYVTGAFPYSTGDQTTVAPLSSTAPQHFAVFSASPYFNTSASGSFFGIPSTEFAAALRGLYELEGYTARVAVIFEWLMAFTANSSFATPANTGPSQVAKTLTGTYDPAIAPADFLALSTGSMSRTPTLTTNGTSLYSTIAAGLLGPLYTASGRSMRTWKDSLSQRRPLNGDPYDLRSPNTNSTTGLSFQLQGSAVASVSMTTLARNAMIYRAQPAAYPLSKAG